MASASLNASTTERCCPLAAEQGGVLAVDEELDAVGMRAHERPLSHALLAAAARKRIRQRLARLVAPERARGERKGIVLFPTKGRSPRPAAHARR